MYDKNSIRIVISEIKLDINPWNRIIAASKAQETTFNGDNLNKKSAGSCLPFVLRVIVFHILNSDFYHPVTLRYVRFSSITQQRLRLLHQ